MRIKSTSKLFCCFLVLLALPAYAQRVAPARVDTVNFESKLVGQALPYHVVLPSDYDMLKERATRYPVLYLLHGLAGSHDDWVSNRAHLAEHAAHYRIIIVTPEGHDGWYTDSATVPNERYESYIVQELLPDVERRYRTIATRAGRAIAGLSMGGYGALKFGVKYPDKFIFAASMSGAHGAPTWDPNDKGLLAFVKPSIVRAYGAMDTPVRPANDLFKLFDELPAERIAQLPFLYLDCGTEDFLIDSNRALAALLLKRKIPHEFRELPGAHTWPYWDNQVQEILRIAARRLAAPQASAATNMPAVSFCAPLSLRLCVFA
jgi:putative tributyrin esterase